MELVDRDFVENCSISEVSNEEALEIVESIIPQMKEIVEEHNALGLAAPQVGIAKKFFIAKNLETNDLELYFNAKYFKKSDSRVKMEEGCLSYPDEKPGVVKRFKSIKVLYQIFDGKTLVNREKVFKSNQAVILQHEIDHCAGHPGSDGRKPKTVYNR